MFVGVRMYLLAHATPKCSWAAPATRLKPSQSLAISPARSFATIPKLPPAKFNTFQITRPEAEKRFKEWENSNRLGPDFKLTGLREVYVPFYTFNIKAATSYTAKIGQDITRWRLKGIVPYRSTELEWNSMTANSVTTEYSSDLEEMQIFASNEFKFALVRVAHTPLSSSNLKDMSELTEEDLKDKEWLPFTLLRHVAREQVFSLIKERELEAGDKVVRAQFDTEHVGDLTARIDFEFFNQPVYLPVYIFEFNR